MDNYLKKEIMQQSRHMFIYGYNGAKRTEFLKSLEKDYPIVCGQEAPMAIYLKDYSLPILESYDKNKNDLRLSSISREYLNFTIISAIIERIISEMPNNDAQNQTVVNTINRIFAAKEYKFNSLEEILLALKESQTFYKQYYTNIMTGDSSFLEMDKLRINFIELNMVLDSIKEALNNSSYFGIIIDHQEKIPTISAKAVNDIVSMRINGDLSMKVACAPDEWETYTGLSGMRIDYVHDYGSVELDESNEAYMLELKKKYFKE